MQFAIHKGIMKNQNQCHCACSLCVSRSLVHFQQLFDHSALNDGTRKTLSACRCLMTAKL